MTDFSSGDATFIQKAPEKNSSVGEFFSRQQHGQQWRATLEEALLEGDKYRDNDDKPEQHAFEEAAKENSAATSVSDSDSNATAGHFLSKSEFPEFQIQHGKSTPKVSADFSLAKVKSSQNRIGVSGVTHYSEPSKVTNKQAPDATESKSRANSLEQFFAHGKLDRSNWNVVEDRGELRLVYIGRESDTYIIFDKAKRLRSELAKYGVKLSAIIINGKNVWQELGRADVKADTNTDFSDRNEIDKVY